MWPQLVSTRPFFLRVGCFSMSASIDLEPHCCSSLANSGKLPYVAWRATATVFRPFSMVTAHRQQQSGEPFQLSEWSRRGVCTGGGSGSGGCGVLLEAFRFPAFCCASQSYAVFFYGLPTSVSVVFGASVDVFCATFVFLLLLVDCCTQ